MFKSFIDTNIWVYAFIESKEEETSDFFDFCLAP
jgi:predicted nucleic acid-binding protein